MITVGTYTCIGNLLRIFFIYNPYTRICDNKNKLSIIENLRMYICLFGSAKVPIAVYMTGINILATTSMPPTKNKVMVALACARTSWTNFLNCLTSSSFPSLSFSSAFLFDVVILYWRKVFAASMDAVNM